MDPHRPARRRPLDALIDWVGSTGEAADREWSSAIVAEAAVLPQAARRRWLLGGLWFLTGRRRPVIAQVVYCLVGLSLPALFGHLLISGLRDDAPDLPAAASVVYLLGCAALVLAFGVAVVRPLRGVLLGVPGYVLFVLTSITGAWLARRDDVSVPPPPGVQMIEPPSLVAGVIEVLAVAVMLGLPAVCLSAVVLLGAVRVRAARET